VESRRDVVIVGGGLAGASCAIAAREAGYKGSIVVLGSEPHIPYSRPGLTKAVLRGEKPVESTFVQDESWYDQHDVDLRTSCRVEAVDCAQRVVRTPDAEFSYGTLVLATGATPRHLDVEGTCERVSVLRTIDDCLALSPHLTPHTRLLVIGGGYIGVEVAASALAVGCEVDLVMREQTLWEHMYGDTVGGYFQRRLAEHGARLHAETSVQRLDDSAEGVRATLANGAVVDADWALAGIGVTPNLDLARDAGLDTDSGVLVDTCLRASSAHVYAVGDIAQYESVLHGRRLRIEHWDVARQQGRYVGERIAAATDEPYRVTPYFFSGLGDWLFMRYVGPGMGDLTIRGSMEEDSFAAAYVKDDRLVACLAVNRDDDLDAARELLGSSIDTSALADSSTPIHAATSGIA
jgi:NADPH-dependent 2,4-dienoyl-CoA reductase/sulfur reductase-like enzyme